MHLFHEGSFVGPFVYGCHLQLNMENLKREYTRRPTTRLYRLRFFCLGERTDFWG